MTRDPRGPYVPAEPFVRPATEEQLRIKAFDPEDTQPIRLADLGIEYLPQEVLGRQLQLPATEQIFEEEVERNLNRIFLD